MAHTYSQIYIHGVFAVTGRQNLVSKKHKEELHQYITGIVRKKKQKLIAKNCMPDHTHILIGLKPDMAFSDLMQHVKANSSRFINEKRWVRGHFNWQEGFGAFSYSHSQLDVIIAYIRNQERHHAKRSFKLEYLDFLKKYAVDYDPKYVFKWIEENE